MLPARLRTVVSPRIEDTAPDTVLLDLSGLESLFGSLPKIARDIIRRTSDLGLEANVATAFNPDTSRFAARGFSGVTVIPAGKEAERLGNLPLEVLFPEFVSSPSEQAANLLEIFDLWGVRNLRALCALPEVLSASAWAGRGFTCSGWRVVRFANSGSDRASFHFRRSHGTGVSMVLLEPLAFLLARMLDQICARLRRALWPHRNCACSWNSRGDTSSRKNSRKYFYRRREEPQFVSCEFRLGQS